MRCIRRKIKNRIKTTRLYLTFKSSNFLFSCAQQKKNKIIDIISCICIIHNWCHMQIIKIYIKQYSLFKCVDAIFAYHTPLLIAEWSGGVFFRVDNTIHYTSSYMGYWYLSDFYLCIENNEVNFKVDIQFCEKYKKFLSFNNNNNFFSSFFLL